MAFTSIVIIVVVLYVLGYTGMIIHDLFIKKDPAEFMPKPKDVEIDISDEAGQFKPITVEKSEPKQPSVTAQSTSSHTPEEIVTAHPIADGESSGKADGEQSAPPPPSATPFESDDAKSEGKTSEDLGPRPTDAETQKRINELVKLLQLDMLFFQPYSLHAAADINSHQIRDYLIRYGHGSTDSTACSCVNVRHYAYL